MLVAFTFWDPAGLESETKRGLYEMRTYTLRVGPHQLILIELLYHNRLELLLNGDRNG